MIHTPDYLVRLSGVILILGCVICPIGSLFTLTSGKYALSSNGSTVGTWEMEEGSKVTLNCTIAPYTQSMSWFYNSCEAYYCTYDNCSDILNCVDRHDIDVTPDTKNGIFLMKIHPVSKRIDNKNFSCFNGNTFLNITAVVVAEDDTIEAEECYTNPYVIAAIGLALLLAATALIIQIRAIVKNKKKTTPTERD